MLNCNNSEFTLLHNALTHMFLQTNNSDYSTSEKTCSVNALRPPSNNQWKHQHS